MYFKTSLTTTDLKYIEAGLLEKGIENIIKECCGKYFEENRRKIYDVIA